MSTSKTYKRYLLVISKAISSRTEEWLEHVQLSIETNTISNKILNKVHMKFCLIQMNNYFPQENWMDRC